MPNRVRSWVKVRFITGFFVIVPVVITAYVLVFFWTHIDSFFSPFYAAIFGRHLPGFGFLTAVVLIFLIGVIATNVVGRRVVLWSEMLLFRLPVVRRIYPAVKQLVEAFSPEKRSSFKEFVLVEHPRKGEYTFGFLTGEVRVEGVETQELVAVFVPTNHLYLGDVILVPREEVIPTGLTIEEGIRIILSAGTAAPRKIHDFRIP
ncbi:MAG: DUF502 domain-containing protein [Candidatus Rokubacteria bacterium]|nr:DUF502 domain-containing protein [Candidatus Rokubacteria bacterium]MBI2878255.1 DUF502 domain-containing protein [Candidatus Rokubacteria bacterium]